MSKYIYILSVIVIGMFSSCSDDDTFSTSWSNRLTMACDTVSFDTVFSAIPTSAKSFWVYNNSSDGIRCSNVRLARGNQSGFRVNVDGVYLGPESGYKTTNLEIRKGDSIRVFVELTTPRNNSDEMLYRSDNLVFTLESGATQQVLLDAWSWDADTVHTLRINADTTISTQLRPLIVFDSIVVAPSARLTIEKGSTIYFHDKAGINVHGSLLCQGDSTANITLRGYRLDNMFDYLPYDMTPGRWKGIHFAEESYGNVIDYTDIHSAFDGIVCDSSDVSRTKLTLSNSIIHNCQGYGLLTMSNKLVLENCQITNTLRDCIAVYGGDVSMLHCTLAQFYPFDARRGDALFFTNWYNNHEAPLTAMSVINSIITGYADDVLMGVPAPANDSTEIAFNYYLGYSLVRTPEIDDTLHCKGNIWEVEDSLGSRHFVKIDSDMQRYDFHLDSISPARGAANPALALPTNRDGFIRDPEHPDMGCY